MISILTKIISLVDLPHSLGEVSLVTVTIQLVLSVLVAVYVVRYWKTAHGGELPPGPVGFPIFGYLPFIGKEPYKKFAELGKTYGSVFSVRLGGRFTVVLNDYQAIKEAFVKQGSVFAGRPTNNIFTSKGQEQVLSASDGPVWKTHRQFAFNSLRALGLGKSSVEPLIKNEIHHFLNKVDELGGQPKDVSKVLRNSIANNICILIFGKRFDYDDADFLQMNHIIDERVKRYNNINSRLCFPWVKRIPFLARCTGLSRSVQLQEDLLRTVRQLISRHRERTLESGQNNYIEDYLEEQDKRRITDPTDAYFDDEKLEGNVIVLLAAGSDTLGLTMSWALKYLMLYPEVQQRVRDELDQVVGEERTPCWDDRNLLPYSMATMMEIMRIASIIPLNIAHSNIHETTLLKYTIPKRSYVISNLWGVHHDPELWGDPENFRPERFLSDDGTVLNVPYFIPFSLGPRTCLGESMARMEYFLYFTMLLQRFVLKPKEGATIDLNCDSGFTLRPTAFETCFISRTR